MKTISAEDFDRKFDDGEDVDDYVDWSKASRPGKEQTNFDLPNGILRQVDAEAARLGTTREALIVKWISEKLESNQRVK
ncbi:MULTISPECIES: type II toxin-antitoxin system BrnA family antitoxin [Rhizobium/Agrobacterium group]|uniref:type II toxin-antitoxin system BrnA family antitoxin n=1 Tax=Rhizobium/Agrobacterium group TaxID=227290 RepID=UPI0022FFDE64|nr:MULTISPECIES: CopG family transcriptional regulator [Rhizobium/Agrobacterium group]MDA5634093.1 CopG family transcriptional regulator [Agrobacterium sp. ST15.16.024]MDF1889608.1 CopG family transcriptional regulator [Rhizobium rhizogenes]